MQNHLAPQLKTLLESLEQGLVERSQCVRLSLLAALAGEHTLLIGPPGTAKSELARRLHSVFRGGRYFERLLTRFTVPEELFGPLSIKALEEDRYERHTDGFLPTASIAFIDEVFKANSAILNALLTLLNEREFDNGAGRMRCPLISVLGGHQRGTGRRNRRRFFRSLSAALARRSRQQRRFCRAAATGQGPTLGSPRRRAATGCSGLDVVG